MASELSLVNDSPPTPSLWDGVKKLLKPVASLELTVILFVLSLILVFFGTLAQMNNGIWTVVDQYFWSWYVMIPVDLVARFGQVFFFVPSSVKVPGALPFPAGKLIGMLMLINLTAAHLVRFRMTWRRTGIHIIHGGLILLFIGEAITRMYQVEQRMVINEGEVTNYAEDTRNHELAFEWTGAEGESRVVVVPATMFAPEKRISHPDLPYDVEALGFYANSITVPLKPSDANAATMGYGQEQLAVMKPEVSGTDPDQKVDLPSAYIRLYNKGTDEQVGTILVSTWLKPDNLNLNNTPYKVSLRNTRIYKPFSVQLIDFRFDRYIGTEKPKNYSSDIRLIDPENEIDREHHIAMNEPLRYAGEAFYQGGFDNATEKTTILQVVRNPGWLIPYISCVMVTVGMMLHFGMYLLGFLRKQSAQAVVKATKLEAAVREGHAPPTSANLVVTLAVLGIAVLYLLSVVGRMNPPKESFNFDAVGQIPVIDGGRAKPLDTFARVSLRAISGREFTTEIVGDKDRTVHAIEWYFEAAAKGSSERNGPAMKYKIFKIDNDQVLAALKLEPRTKFLYALEEFAEQIPAFSEVANKSFKKPTEKRDLFDRKVIEVADRLQLYMKISSAQLPLVVPIGGDVGDERMMSLQDSRERIAEIARNRVFATNQIRVEDIPTLTDAERTRLESEIRTIALEEIKKVPTHEFWNSLLISYRKNESAEFNADVRKYQPSLMAGASPLKMQLETYYNRFAPFYECVVLYGMVIVACILSWIGLTESFRRGAFWLLLGTAAIHFTSLIIRMYLQDRWLVFVTNLYSSAIFIGFGCVILGLLLERVYPIGVGNLVGGVLGLATTIISHQIGASGDTMEMMQAVLDTNFWLATHVTTVTFGYTATFVAGALGILYVVMGMFTRKLTPEVNKMFANMIYGVVAFALLLSFVGTVLGGIWADQSWGRFWGWDPKENGAVLIVIWNALILHARWGGIVKTRGIAVLAILGNMVTAWSWFGTNQLGIGLHAYGFDNTLAMVCTGIWVSHLLIALMGTIPTAHWLSFEQAPTAQRRTAVASSVVNQGGASKSVETRPNPERLPESRRPKKRKR